MTRKCPACRCETSPGYDVCLTCGASLLPGQWVCRGRPRAVWLTRVLTLAAWMDLGLGVTGCFFPSPLLGVFVAICAVVFAGWTILISGEALIPRAVALAMIQGIAGCWLGITIAHESSFPMGEALITAGMVAAAGTVALFPLVWRLWARPLPSTDPWQCRLCGYLLYDLHLPRCPECGTPFTPPKFRPTSEKQPLRRPNTGSSSSA